MRAAMLDAVQRGWQAYAEKGEFRSAQITVRIDPDRIRDAFEAFSRPSTSTRTPSATRCSSRSSRTRMPAGTHRRIGFCAIRLVLAKR